VRIAEDSERTDARAAFGRCESLAFAAILPAKETIREDWMAAPVRRIVAGVDDGGKASVLIDGASPDVKVDPARPGFAATRVWVTDSSPAKVKGVRDTLHLPHSLDAPGGTTFWCFEFPPERSFVDKITQADVKAYFASMGSRGASTARDGKPHPYMQRTDTMDFCHILDGDITLVLDTQEVDLKEGDTVVIRGANHAWSNRSSGTCRILVSQHAGAGDYRKSASAPLVGRPKDAGMPLLRRVVIGHDEAGRSCVTHDSDTPLQIPRSSGSTFFELWTIEAMPAPLDSPIDSGTVERPLTIPPPPSGAHWRVTHSLAKDFDPKLLSEEERRRHHAQYTDDGADRRPDSRHWGMHRTPTVDYAIVLEGERLLLLEDEDIVMRKGDICIQLGNFHSWGNVPGIGGKTSFIMIGGEFG
jgi:quercetin dioxygenase-like cupin family protein